MMMNGEVCDYVKIIGIKLGVFDDSKIIDERHLKDDDEAIAYIEECRKCNDVIWVKIPQSVIVHN